MNNDEDFQAMIKKYNEEMKKYIKPAAAQPTSPTAPAQPITSAPPAATTAPAPAAAEQPERSQLPMQTPQSDTPPESAAEQGVVVDQPLEGVGYITVEATTANGALPVEDATVIISRKINGEDNLIYSLFTDKSGETRTVPLETVSKELSLDPNIENPYTVYQIKTIKAGYFTVDDLNVPIFDTQSAFQPVNMIPLPENYQNNSTVTVDEKYDEQGGSANA